MKNDGIMGLMIFAFGLPMWGLYILVVLTIVKKILERWWME